MHTLALGHGGRLVWPPGTLRLVEVFDRIPLKEHPNLKLRDLSIHPAILIY